MPRVFGLKRIEVLSVRGLQPILKLVRSFRVVVAAERYGGEGKEPGKEAGSE